MVAGLGAWLATLPRPREWPSSVVRAWRRSLHFRTIAITVALSGTAMALTGVSVSYSVGNDLYQSRLRQALADSARATTSTQATLDSADATDPAAVQGLLNKTLSSIQTATSTRLVAVFRAPDQGFDPLAPTDFTTFGVAPGEASPKVVSDALREAVQNGAGKQFYQSVTLTADDGSKVPGLVVGSEIVFPSAGRYELYVGFNLSDSEQTLAFVQGTLWAAGVALMLLIGAVTWVVVHFVVAPIRLAATTSQRLAAGDLEVRIPQKGEDVFATLARSFNGMADSLQHQINQLAELSQVQQRFVSDVSHELRTPLTTIRLAGDVIYDQRATFPPATERTAELLHTQIQRFDALLSDLLEISRYDAGSAALDLEPTSLVHLVDDAIEGLGGLVGDDGSAIRLVAPGGWVEVEMDPRRIRRVVRNLVGNAIEHGEGKPIVVMVDSNESAVALSVRDYGIGMTEEACARVFDRFWRADPSRRRTLGGTGLGLSIALEDAALHHGRLEVWSRPGLGSCFRLTLPRVPGSDPGESPLSLPPADAGASAPDELIDGEVVS